MDEIFIGCALPAGLGQNPAQTVATKAGVPASRAFTTVNKVCASGMKAVSLGAQQIQLALADVVVVGGIESMSNVPNYVPRPTGAAKEVPADVIPKDGMMTDGLIDARTGVVMGVYAEECAVKEGITRGDQDNYAIRSYTLSKKATDSGYFANEIVPIVIKKDGMQVTIAHDQIRTLDIDRMRSCRPAFAKENGTVTGPNSSSLSDGAACLILVSERALKVHNLKPIAEIRGYSDSGDDNPANFTTAPTGAVEKCLSSCGISINEVDYFEINEAFAVVALANQRKLKIDTGKLNVFGGAVALGHPLGCSGARIIVTLLNVLRTKNSRIGCAAICNGGGGASAIVIETLH